MILSCEAIRLASQVRVYCGVSPPGAVSMRPEDIGSKYCVYPASKNRGIYDKLLNIKVL